MVKRIAALEFERKEAANNVRQKRQKRYVVGRVWCGNCKATSDDVSIPCGRPISQNPCPECGCVGTLHWQC